MAMLAKQAWRISQRPDSLLAQIYKAKYFPHSSFWEASTEGNLSYAWRSILASRPLLKQGTRWTVGNGEMINPWEDAWIPQLPSFTPSPRRMGERYGISKVVDVLTESKDWNIEKLNECFQDFVVEYITQIPISHTNQADRVVWNYSTSGQFTVKSAYTMAYNSKYPPRLDRDDPIRSMWRRMWKLKLPGKVKMHMWKCGRGILPTGSQLWTKNVYVQNGCTLCNGEWETIPYALFECPTAAGFWTSWPNIKRMMDEAPYFLRVVDWLVHCQNELCKDEFEQMLFGSWILWKERNMRLWTGKSISIEAMSCQAKGGLIQYRNANVKKNREVGKQPAQRWKTPSQGWIKANVKGLVNVGGKVSGIGIVLRDHEANIVGGVMEQLLNRDNMLLVEAVAVRMACEMIQEWKLEPAIIEVESQQVVQMINTQLITHSTVGMIIQDIVEYCESSSNLYCKYVKRETNRAARILANKAQSCNTPIHWSGQPPEIVVSALATPCNI